MAFIGYKNISLLDSQIFISDAILVIEKNKIYFAGQKTEFSSKCPIDIQNKIQWHDGRGQWVTPGFINSHTHVSMSFMRDLAHNKKNMIESFFFPLEKKLTPEDIYHFSFPSLAAGLKSGVTSFVDHYYHIEGVEHALKDIEARGFVAETLADLGGAKPHRARLDQQVSTKQWNANGDQLVNKILGPHAMDTVSEDYMREIADCSKKYQIPLHMHLSQTKNEFDTCMSKYKKTPVEVALSCDALSDRTLAVHLITSTDSDHKILKQTSSFIGLCPTSQVLYEHIAPLKKFYQQSLPGVLGTDCAASHDSMDIMSELRALYLCYRHAGVAITPHEILKTVWDNPAAWLNCKIGKLQAGYFADLIFFKRGLESEPCHDPHSHLISTLSANQIEHVIINGKAVVEKRNIIHLDEVKKIENLQSALKKYI